VSVRELCHNLKSSVVSYRFFSLILFFATLPACERHETKATIPPPVQTSFIQAIDIMKHSVAPVVCLSIASDGSAKLDFIEGSAFFISSAGEFVTARHVITEMQPAPQRRPCNAPAIYIPRNGKWPDDGRFLEMKWFTFHLEQCALSSPAVDLARCKTQDDLSHDKEISVPPAPAQIDAALPPEGSDIAFMGFPLQILLPRTARATVAGYGSRDNTETTDIVIDRSTWPGASGSPIFSINGHVIGVVLARGTNDAQGLAFARTGNLLDRFLKSQ
jgi:S1-C subfamily serine protease